MRKIRREMLFGLTVSALAFAVPALSSAAVIDFTGTITTATVVPGTVFPPGFQIPGTFNGSFLYDPTQPAPFVISDVVVDFGTFEITKDATSHSGVTTVSPYSISYINGSSLGLSGSLANQGVELNDFELAFAEPAVGPTIDPASPDFSAFTTKTLTFDMGELPDGGDVHAVGTLDIASSSVPVPEGSPLPLMAGGLLAIAAVLRLRKRQAPGAWPPLA